MNFFEKWPETALYKIIKDLTIPFLSFIVALVIATIQIKSCSSAQQIIVRPKSGWLPKIIDKDGTTFDIVIINVGEKDVTYRLEMNSSFSTISSESPTQQDPTLIPNTFRSYKIFLGSKDSYTHKIKISNLYESVNYNPFKSTAYIKLSIFDDYSNKELYKSQCFYTINKDFAGNVQSVQLDRPFVDTTGNAEKQYQLCTSL